jgi:hypothetical protein
MLYTGVQLFFLGALDGWEIALTVLAVLFAAFVLGFWWPKAQTFAGCRASQR